MRLAVSDASHTRADLGAGDLIGPLWRRRWLILAIVVVSTAGTFVVSSSRAESYRATARVLVQTSTVQGLLNQPPLTTPERAIADQALLVRSRPVAERVIARRGLDESADELLADVTSAPAPGSNVVSVTAERSSAAGAVDVADAFVAEFISLGLEQLKAEIDDSIAKARRELSGLRATPANKMERQILRDGVARLSAAEAVLPPQGRQVDRATAVRVDNRPGRDALFAFVTSALFAITLAYALEWWSRRGTGVSEPAIGEPDPAPSASVQAAPEPALRAGAPVDVDPKFSRGGSL
jgi:capsular polysaccharide biosynthesis protein